MRQILKWQYDQLIKELILLQEHMADPSCPCGSAGEMCVRKHLLTIEAYAQETVPMEDDFSYQEKLKTLAAEAKGLRDREEKALCGEAEQLEMLEWPRRWRKEFETYSLACEVAEPEEAEETEQACEVRVETTPVLQ